uniref:6-phosphogluconolactonase n=1 Tax=Bionectria ochroleuca TaxID=29856 RepID=A0A8H7NAH6_BIOOC
MPKTQPNLYAFSGVDALAPALRKYIVQSQALGLARHGIFKVAVSGGSLPKTLAAALLAPSTPDDDVIDFKKWEIFFADERVVPLDHADSNYALLKSELLDKLPADQQPTVHTIDVAHLDDLQEVADSYEQVLVSSFASRDSVRLPIFDLLLLGCGPDGHTCSLFPGHPLLRETNAWVAPIDDSPKPPPKRITLTLPVVTHAVRVAFVATGGGKKDIMKDIFDADKGLPCALVNEGAGDRASWFVDEPAIQGVSFPGGRSYEPNIKKKTKNKIKSNEEKKKKKKKGTETSSHASEGESPREGRDYNRATCA